MRNKIKECSKCKDTDFGVWTSSSTGKVYAYCRACRRERAAKYTHRKNVNGGRHSNREWLEKLSSFSTCPNCNMAWNEIPKRPDKRYKQVWTKDHIVPVTAGGTNDISNIQPLCYRCNSSKCHRIPMRQSDKLLMPLPDNCVEAEFISRPQRFLIKAKLNFNRRVTAYCANPGSMNGCEVQGSKILLCDSKDRNRKRKHTWKAICIQDTWVGADTHVSNDLVFESIKRELLPEFRGFKAVAREAPIAKKSRVDFLLENSLKRCWIEVKSSFVVKEGIAQFPDSISPRSLMQIKHLARKVKSGDRAAVVFVVQRGDAKSFKVNSKTFPMYAKALKLAVKYGVEILVLRFSISRRGYSNPTKLKWAIE